MSLKVSSKLLINGMTERVIETYIYKNIQTNYIVTIIVYTSCIQYPIQTLIPTKFKSLDHRQPDRQHWLTKLGKI